METAPTTTRPPGAAPGGGQPAPFTPYQKLVVAMLAFLQFTIVLDFMILSPLGAFLLHDLGITTKQFGLVVSVYAFSAGASGLLAAGFADKFDRKKLLLFFYCGFVLGTFLCGIATSYKFLLIARMVTGLFGGVIGSVSFAIITDLFPLQLRGRVMGAVQTAFAASQVLGLPIGLELTTRFNWHAPFLMIVGVSAIAGVVILLRLKPVDGHLKLRNDRNPLAHLLHTATRPRYLVGFSATMLMATGGFMLMPFGSAFSINNMHVTSEQLKWVYLATGLTSIGAGLAIGKISDTVGKYAVFCASTLVGLLVVVYFTHLEAIPLWHVILVNAVLFVCISGRMISASALASGMPAPPDRGAYMAISSSVQQLSGGMAASIAGLIVVQAPSGRIEHYPTLGWVVAVVMLLTIALMFNVNRLVRATAPVARPSS